MKLESEALKLLSTFPGISSSKEVQKTIITSNTKATTIDSLLSTKME